jgi:DHA1 family 2-module integral membrane pump EmrD-like MFS transporter
MLMTLAGLLIVLSWLPLALRQKRHEHEQAASLPGDPASHQPFTVR